MIAVLELNAKYSVDSGIKPGDINKGRGVRNRPLRTRYGHNSL